MLHDRSVASLIFSKSSMTSQSFFYPLSNVIRCIAKAYLVVTPEARKGNLVWDEALFTELTATFLHPDVQPLLTSPYTSRYAAALVEKQLAKSLVDDYCRILRQRQDTQVCQLNTLLTVDN